MPPRRLIAAVLVVLASALAGLARLVDKGSAPPADVRPPGAERTAAPAPLPEAPRGDGPGRLGDAALDAQVQRVIESMDATGRPPDGVAQGGRRGGKKGVFENAEGRLPRHERGYWTETDVWPRRSGGRGTQRLIFGKEREVYYTGDHYRTFTRLR